MPINGTPNNCSADPSLQFVLPDTNNSSYTRGEGIALFNSASDRGRAPRANGGGSGASGDSGGGGGANYGAGGEGGKRWCDVSGANAGGFGGYAMTTYLAQDKAFLGGAGGPGWVSTNNPSTAADGGGIVIIFADEIIGNGHFINANGLSPLAVNPVGAPDGGGGGGAGGSVVLKVNRYTTNLTVNINGGDGQDLNIDLNTNVAHGPGGGGGGGVLLYSKATLPANLSLNTTGGIGGQHLNGFRNDSRDGQSGGSVSLYIPIENPNYVGNTDTDSVPQNCDLDDDNDGILDTVEYGVLPDPFGDADSDRIPNYFDPSAPGFVDTNTDGIDDRYDTDLDGVLNQLDLDSDNDGCSDANEYYNSSVADGGDGGVYGTGTPTVDASGRVNGPVAAPYSGAYTNVTSLGSASVLNPSTPSNQSTAVGGNVSFTTTITTSGSGTTQHQWQVSTDNGASWSNIANGGVYSGATTATLSITAAVVSMNGYDYRDIVTQSNYVCGTVTSAGANLCVVAATLSSNSPVCSGSDAIFTITGTPGNTVTYSGAASGTVTIGAGGTVAVTVTGVTANTTLNITNVSNGTCNPTLNATATVTVNALPVAATLSSNSPVCFGSDAIFTITGTAGNTVTYSGAASGTATIGAGGTVAVTVTGVTSNTTLNLSNVSNGSCNRTLTATATVTVNALPVVPTISSTAASCSSAETSTISNYSASNTYTFDPATPGITINTTTGLISGLTVGTDYTVTSGNGSCTSVASAIFNNAAQLVTPDVPTISSTAASCSSAETSTISNYSASNTYTFDPATPGITINTTTGLISGLTVGTDYTVTSGNGSCTSVASAIFNNAAQLVTPARTNCRNVWRNQLRCIVKDG